FDADGLPAGAAQPPAGTDQQHGPASAETTRRTRSENARRRDQPERGGRRAGEEDFGVATATRRAARQPGPNSHVGSLRGVGAKVRSNTSAVSLAVPTRIFPRFSANH